MVLQVLFVDDDPDTLVIARRFLQKHAELEVTTVDSAEKAIEVIDTMDFDVLVTDYEMSPMNGLDLLRILREKNEILPIIVFTGMSREEVAIKALNLGATQYVKKEGDPAVQYAELAHIIINSAEYTRALQDLILSQQRYKQLAEVIDAMVFIIDENDNYIEFYDSPKISPLLPPEEFLGKHVSEVTPEPVQSMFLEAQKKVREDGQQRYLEYELEIEEGTRWYSLTLSLHGDEKSILGIVQDITEWKESQQKLKRSDTKYQQIIDDSLQGIIIFSINDMKVLYANKAMAEIMACSVNDLLELDRKKMLESIHSEDRERLVEQLEKRNKGLSVPERYQYRLINSREQVRWMDVRVTMTTFDGQPAILAAQLDITDRKRLLDSLQKTESWFTQFADNIDEAFWITELNPPFDTIYLSPGFERIFGIDSETAKTDDTTFLNVIHPDDRERILLEIRRHFEDDKKYDTEFRIIKSGTVRWIHARGFHVRNDEGTVIRSIGFAQDITERKEIEHSIRAQREELGDFAHMIAHDIRGYFSNIVGLTQLLKGEYDEEYLDRIETLSYDALRILDKSVELADAGAVIGNKTEVDLNEIIDSISSNIIPKNILFERDDLPTISCDRERMVQLVHNMLLNAVEHGSPNSIEIRVVDAPYQYELIFKNDGTPIPQEIQAVLLHKGYSCKHGRGKGFQIILKIAAAHGWEISLESGKDTVFKLIIPKN
ncbi:MAG: putative Histidine kinase [Candidatus Thorarchaeota archaeon]|nr:MAG: putative Histidine kinase [Candidatus Thorarchaeota archaeon]